MHGNSNFMISRYSIFYIYCLMILFIFMVSCKERVNVIHIGEKHSKFCFPDIDTIYVALDDASGIGNFYLRDTVITFVDAVNYKFYDLNFEGHLLSSYFGKGHGKNELVAMRYAYPIENDSLNRGIIVDHNNVMTIFNIEKQNIIHRKQIDFGWDKKGWHLNQYRFPDIYNIMEFADFGISFYLLSDTTLLFPINIVNRMTKNPDKIDSRRYEDGAIFGKLDLTTMKVEEVLGKFPEIYKHNPMPEMEFFQYVVADNLLYVNHAVDSLIYVYQYPNNLQYTIGYECTGIDRSYTITKLTSQNEIFQNDIQRIGLNTGLVLCSENNTLCRTYMKKVATGTSGLQIYRNNNLLADVEMPAYFKLLGYHGGYYYGVRLIPLEDMEHTYIVLYRIQIPLD